MSPWTVCPWTVCSWKLVLLHLPKAAMTVPVFQPSFGSLDGYVSWQYARLCLDVGHRLISFQTRWLVKGFAREDCTCERLGDLATMSNQPLFPFNPIERQERAFKGCHYHIWVKRGHAIAEHTGQRFALLCEGNRVRRICGKCR